MTVAEELIQEGREQGHRQAKTVAEKLIQEGRQQTMTVVEALGQQNKIKFIKAMLNLNFDAATIATAAELTLAEVNTIIDKINRTHTP